MPVLSIHSNTFFFIYYESDHTDPLFFPFLPATLLPKKRDKMKSIEKKLHQAGGNIAILWQ
jgi:hypothetical protein